MYRLATVTMWKLKLKTANAHAGIYTTPETTQEQTPLSSLSRNRPYTLPTHGSPVHKPKPTPPSRVVHVIVCVFIESHLRVDV